MSLHRANILGYPVDLVDYQSAFEIITSALKSKNKFHVVTLNPEMIIAAQNNSELHDSIASAEFIIPDGVGILLALWMQRIKLKKTIPGIELAEKCIEYSSKNNVSVAFLGAMPDVIPTMLEVFRGKYPDLNVIFSRDGYYQDNEEENIAIEIASNNPGILLVALGVPKQEIWIKKYEHLFPNTVLIGVGGSFNVWSGKVKRAPKIFRDFKAEWLYRLLSEPFRAKRIFSALPYFVFQLLLAPKKKFV